MRIFYRNNADAIIAAHMLASTSSVKTPASLYRIDKYGESLANHLSDLKENEKVVLIGACAFPEDLAYIKSVTTNLYVVDNNLIAKEFISEAGFRFNGSNNFNPNAIRGNIRTDKSLSALLLSSIVGHFKCGSKYGRFPYVVSLLDGWSGKENEFVGESKFFMIGLSTVDIDVGDYFVERMLKDVDFVKRIILDGHAIDSDRTDRIQRFADLYGYGARFKGHLCFIINAEIADISMLDGTIADEFDIVLSIVFTGENVEVTALSRHDGPNLLEVFDRFPIDGTPHIAEFNCDPKELFILSPRDGMQFIREIKYFKLKRPIPVVVDYKLGVYTVSIPELMIERSSRDIGYAKKQLAKDIYEIALVIKRKEPVARIDSTWTPVDAYRIVKFLGTYLLFASKYKRSGTDSPGVGSPCR